MLPKGAFYPSELEAAMNAVRERFNEQEKRIVNLEQQLKSQATQQQATEHLYAPLRSDTKSIVDLAAFARRLLNPQDLGYAVTLEVRNAARRALGLPEVKEYDL